MGGELIGERNVKAFHTAQTFIIIKTYLSNIQVKLQQTGQEGYIQQLHADILRT